MKDTTNNFDLPLHDRNCPCTRTGCRGTMWFADYCGAYVCDRCEQHKGLARCYCGWATSGGDGRRELIDMGETIGDE